MGEEQDVKCPEGAFIQDLKLVYNKADSTTRSLQIICQDPVHRSITKLTTDPNEQFEKYLTLENSDPYYFCGLQLKYLSGA